MRRGGVCFLFPLLLTACAAKGPTGPSASELAAELRQQREQTQVLEKRLAATEKRLKSLERYMHFTENTDITVTRQEQKNQKGLRVVARPPAEVFINGQAVGRTPYENFKLKNGKYTLRLEHPDYDPIEEVIEIRDREVETLNITFR